MRIATIQTDFGLAPNEPRDMVYYSATLSGGVVVTAVPQPVYFAGYDQGTLAVQNVRIEATVTSVSPALPLTYLTFIRWTVRNVGNTPTGQFVVFVDGV
jgi:hypothetical protein